MTLKTREVTRAAMLFKKTERPFFAILNSFVKSKCGFPKRSELFLDKNGKNEIMANIEKPKHEEKAAP